MERESYSRKQLRKVLVEPTNCAQKKMKQELIEDSTATWSYEEPKIKEEIKTEEEYIEDCEDTEVQASGSEYVKMPKRFNYTEEDMANALRVARSGRVSIRRAAKMYKVPKTTVLDKIRLRTPEIRKIGRDPYLCKELEERLVRWIRMHGKRGSPPKKDDVLNSVQQIVKKESLNTPFHDGRPGETWFKAFLRRNPTVTIRTPEGVSKARANVTEEAIRAWFATLRGEMEEIGELDIFDDATRTFNTDETNIQLCPKTGNVLSIKGWKNVYELSPGPEKSTLTFLRTFQATGEVVVPNIIFPYVRLPQDIVSNVPDHWHIGTSENGWMRTENFYEYIANGFIPWVNAKNIKKPVLLFVDGHKTHLSIEVNQLCEDNGVILYVLPPNTTHILQPADVGTFKSLKLNWKQAVRAFRQREIREVTQKDVAPILNDVLLKIPKSAIVNCFKATGLCPFNPDRPDYSKILNVTIDSELELHPPQNIVETFGHSESEAYSIALQIIEKELDAVTVNQLKGQRCSNYKLQNLYIKVASKSLMSNRVHLDVENPLDHLPDTGNNDHNPDTDNNE